jgi:hypothetical protein
MIRLTAPIAALLLSLSAGSSLAQSTPGYYNGQVLTAGQLNLAFAGKQDYNAGFFTQPQTWAGPQTWSANGVFQAHLALTGSAPSLSSCGSSPAVAGSDMAGEVTTGTATPTSCTITFHVAYQTAPVCVVVDRSALANLTSYTVTTTAIVLTTLAASSQKIDYVCHGT